jgi:hypothetical protein
MRVLINLNVAKGNSRETSTPKVRSKEYCSVETCSLQACIV